MYKTLNTSSMGYVKSQKISQTFLKIKKIGKVIYITQSCRIRVTAEYTKCLVLMMHIFKTVLFFYFIFPVRYRKSCGPKPLHTWVAPGDVPLQLTDKNHCKGLDITNLRHSNGEDVESIWNITTKT